MEYDTEEPEPLPKQDEQYEQHEQDRLPEAANPAEPDRVPEMLDALEPDEMPDAPDGVEADEAFDHDARSAGRRRATGEPRVDDALRNLDDLAELPVSEHPAVFEHVHTRLRDVLGELDSGAQGRQGS
jgi:hypothetical protein